MQMMQQRILIVAMYAKKRGKLMSQVDDANLHANALICASKETLAMVSPEKRARLKNALDGSECLVPERKVCIASWSTVLDIVQYGLEGDIKKVRQYSELLLQRLEKDEQEIIVNHLKKVLKGDKGQMIYLAEEKGNESNATHN
jgi:hypothetical protein